MALYSAYFDESDSNHCSVVAGVILSVSQLPHFEREWRLLLDEEKLGYFHMKEFAHFKGEFKSGWRGDSDRRANFLSRAIGIIARRCNISIGITLDRTGYQKAISVSPLVASFYVNEYTAASFMTLMRVGTWADRNNHSDSITYVFDDGNPKRSDFDRAFHTAKAVPELRSQYRLGDLSFDDDKRLTPLQAADFIAYEVCKVYSDIANNEQRLRRSMKALLKQVNGDWRIGSEDMLLKLAQQANVI
ncbi:MAG TPA: DUF3800 domain-containing protein [Bryobacteraceae bacterium]|jgi:uncharacterized protein DUF3800|nr:DUF3800 domain-containing protein [Bryobacteraceae bacterium]